MSGELNQFAIAGIKKLAEGGQLDAEAMARSLDVPAEAVREAAGIGDADAHAAPAAVLARAAADRGLAAWEAEARAAADEFENWLAVAAAGERRVYHLGDLASDRIKSAAINAVAMAAWGACAAGEIQLTQRKIGAGEYQYIARRLPRGVGGRRRADRGDGP